uniref:Uncharacterized protein n=1 Tax=Arundo donax TaxID=35708 RepID=A0A0A9AUB5_ARUDO
MNCNSGILNRSTEWFFGRI